MKIWYTGIYEDGVFDRAETERIEYCCDAQRNDKYDWYVLARGEQSICFSSGEYDGFSGCGQAYCFACGAKNEAFEGSRKKVVHDEYNKYGHAVKSHCEPMKIEEG